MIASRASLSEEKFSRISLDPLNLVRSPGPPKTDGQKPGSFALIPKRGGLDKQGLQREERQGSSTKVSLAHPSRDAVNYTTSKREVK